MAGARVGVENEGDEGVARLVVEEGQGAEGDEDGGGGAGKHKGELAPASGGQSGIEGAREEETQ